MAFGAGVLISALAFDLMDEAYRQGGFDSAAAGFLGGAGLYTAATWWLNHHGAKHRKRSGQSTKQPSEAEAPGSGLAIAYRLRARSLADLTDFAPLSRWCRAKRDRSNIGCAAMARDSIALSTKHGLRR